MSNLPTTFSVVMFWKQPAQKLIELDFFRFGFRSVKRTFFEYRLQRLVLEGGISVISNIHWNVTDRYFLLQQAFRRIGFLNCGDTFCSFLFDAEIILLSNTDASLPNVESRLTGGEEVSGKSDLASKGYVIPDWKREAKTPRRESLMRFGDWRATTNGSAAADLLVSVF